MPIAQTTPQTPAPRGQPGRRAQTSPLGGGARPPAHDPVAVTGLAARWRLHGAALVVLVAAILLLYRDTAASMVGIWMRSDTFAHAFVVPPLSLWLAWRLRAHLALQRPQAVPWLALPLAGLAGVWWLGELVSTNSVTQLMLMAMLVAAVPAVLGWQVARTLMFPLGFLFFAVPVGEFLTPMLIQHTADFVIAALRLSGIPVYREGNQFVIPSGHWSVVEACSGIRYLMASLMAGSLFAYLNYRSLTRRWLFVGVAILVPVVANWLRAYMIVMLGHLSDNKIATGVDHLLYGWVFFGVVIMAMFWLGARWAEADAPPPVDTGAGLRANPQASAAWLVAAVVAAVVAVAWPPLVVGRQAAQPAPALATLALPSQLPGGWATAAPSLPDWQPSLQNPNQSLQREYSRNGEVLGVHIAWFQDQRADRKLVSSENLLVTSHDPRWNQVSSGQAPATGVPDVATVRTASLLGATSALTSVKPKLRVWQLYWVAGHFTHSDLLAKLYQALQVMRGQGDGGAVVLLYTSEDSADAADARLTGFLSTEADTLNGLLRAMHTP